MTRLCLILCVLAGCGDVEEASELTPFQCPSDAGDDSAFAVRVVSFQAGSGAGFGDEAAVLGPPRGQGEANGGLDVLTLGDAGSVTVELGADVVDCQGPDLVVFENPFAAGNLVYTELGSVSVSLDGERWSTFECDPDGAAPHEGCAGVNYVYAAEDGIDARDPKVSGGDAFDLAHLGLSRARYVRIVDLERTNGLRAPPSRGFDLDAVAIVRGHSAPR